MSQSEKKFVENIQQQLSDSLDDLDSDILLRLKQARSQAVQTAVINKSENRSDVISLVFPQWLAPASTAAAFATIAFVAVTLWTQPLSIIAPLAPSIIEDIAVLSSADDLDFYENLDFYIWLENEDTAS